MGQIELFDDLSVCKQMNNIEEIRVESKYMKHFNLVFSVFCSASRLNYLIAILADFNWAVVCLVSILPRSLITPVSFPDHFKGSNHNGYLCPPPSYATARSSGSCQPSRFLLFSSYGVLEWKIHKMTNSFLRANVSLWYQVDSGDITVLNKYSYLHALEQVNDRIATSVVVVGLCFDPTEVKVVERTKLCFSSQHKGLFTAIICKKLPGERKRVLKLSRSR